MILIALRLKTCILFKFHNNVAFNILEENFFRNAFHHFPAIITNALTKVINLFHSFLLFQLHHKNISLYVSNGTTFKQISR